MGSCTTQIVMALRGRLHSRVHFSMKAARFDLLSQQTLDDMLSLAGPTCISMAWPVLCRIGQVLMQASPRLLGRRPLRLLQQAGAICHTIDTVSLRRLCSIAWRRPASADTCDSWFCQDSRARTVSPSRATVRRGAGYFLEGTGKVWRHSWTRSLSCWHTCYCQLRARPNYRLRADGRCNHRQEDSCGSFATL